MSRIDKIKVDGQFIDLGPDVSAFLTANDVSNFITEDELPEDIVVQNDISTFITATDVSNNYVKQSTFDALVNSDINGTIDKFNEVESFLAGVSDASTLTGMMGQMKTEIEGEIPTVPTTVSSFTNDAGYLVSNDVSNYCTDNDISTFITANDASIYAQIDVVTASDPMTDNSKIYFILS